MKIWKGIIILIFFTVIALFYVHQQVNIIIAGYNYQENKVKLDYLFDKNRYLKYNVNKLNSPSHLFAALNGVTNRNFKLAGNFKIKRVSGYKTPIRKNRTKESSNLLSHILSFGSKAEAKILKEQNK